MSFYPAEQLYPKLSGIGIYWSLVIFIIDNSTSTFALLDILAVRLMENARLLGLKNQQAMKNLQQAKRHLQEVYMEFRTMDKDINIIRPRLMKLQRTNDDYTRSGECSRFKGMFK